MRWTPSGTSRPSTSSAISFFVYAISDMVFSAGKGWCSSLLGQDDARHVGERLERLARDRAVAVGRVLRDDLPLLEGPALRQAPERPELAAERLARGEAGREHVPHLDRGVLGEDPLALGLHPVADRDGAGDPLPPDLGAARGGPRHVDDVA